MSDMNFRLGIIVIDAELYDCAPDHIFAIYKKILPFIIEFDTINKAYKVTGKSMLFSPVEPGKPIPTYKWTIKKAKFHDPELVGVEKLNG